MVGIRKKKKLILFVTGTLVMVLIVVCSISSDTYTDFKSDGNYKVTYTNSYFKEKPAKTILLWTTMFNHRTLDSDRKCLSTCPVKCDITDDKSQIRKADAVEFHLSNLWTKFWRVGTKSIIELPSYRTPDQVWILANMEPPPHLWGNIRIFNGLFNWTRWYRNDADISWPYGEVYRYNKTERIKAENKYENRNFYEEKSREIMLRISNCFDPGQRYRIIQELNKFVEIDKYGKCYDKVCGVSTDPADKSCDILMKQYKFYLALENDICKDYITEKYWLTLERDQIPIVNWKDASPDTAIPKSFINIFDFDSIAQLAQYVKQVSANETLYNSYFEYKKFYTNRQRSCHACSVCHSLHDKSRPAQVYTDIDGWVQNDSCEKVGLWNNFLKNFYGWRFLLLGF
ncbi:alpha-(1,3)-fucosyltransferase fut-3-like [Mercenaria mercenaria]|uniref:alpha-(1,3)-fucosyltransferase fut-3-like n=1 Tax=Mercenaria mercenaria TaxID=6596 RepID=UPI00234F682F|nr:alpha-(1,3)-fucosyltransferase fut-3-like [Mercenaria mercenaria]